MSASPIILHIITGLSTGGAEMMLLRLASRLQSQCEQTVISLTQDGSVGKRLRASGVPVYTMARSSRAPGPASLWRLVRMMGRFRPDIVQTWMYHADLLGGLAARVAGRPRIVWNIRNNELPVESTSLRTRAVVRACAALSSQIPVKVVCCSKAAMETHGKMGYARNRMLLIPNGFELERFRPDPEARAAIRAELDLTTNTPLVGLIARYDPQKDHETFFRAVARLHMRRPDVHFLLAGSGIDLQNMKIAGWVGESGARDVLHLLGERSDVPRLLAALDIATLSSSSEAFPNVLGEAMACGTPCVATNVGDAALIVSNYGVVVPRHDPDALAKGWERILSLGPEERKKLGEAARRHIEANFDMEVIATRYLDLYEQLASGAA